MDNKETISDEEQLYRSVRGELSHDEYTYDATGRLKLDPRLFVIETRNRPWIEPNYGALIPLFLD